MSVPTPIAGQLDVFETISGRRVDGELLVPPAGPLILSYSTSFQRYKYNGVITLPNPTVLVAPAFPATLRRIAYTVEVWFSAPGQTLLYADSTVAYTSQKTNEVVIARYLDPLPGGQGTWKFAPAFDYADLSSITTWVPPVQTCGFLPPPFPIIGERWLDLTTNQIGVWDGAMWVYDPQLPGFAVSCIASGSVYIYDGFIWNLSGFLMVVPELGLEPGFASNSVRVDNGRGITFAGNKTEASLGAGLAFDTGLDASPFSVQIDGSLQIVGNEIGIKSYIQNFVIADWVPFGPDWRIVILGIIHGKGVGVNPRISTPTGVRVFVDFETVDPVSGDITLQVPGTPDARFDGRIVV